MVPLIRIKKAVTKKYILKQAYPEKIVGYTCFKTENYSESQQIILHSSIVSIFPSEIGLTKPQERRKEYY